MVEDAIRKAEVLVEALSYIRQFRHRVVVIKLGGSVIEHADSLASMLEDVVFLETVGLRPILVHGGGKAISEAMDRAGLQPRFIQGRRYTDAATLEIVSNVLADEINAQIVRGIEQHGGWALGLHHRTTPCLFGEKLALEEGGQRIDLGQVGRVTRIDEIRLHKLCAAGIIPVLPSIAVAGTSVEEAIAGGELLNVNADTAAAAVAGFLKAEKLVFVSDTPGILAERASEASLIRSLSAAECRRLITAGVIEGGMIPKVEACLESLHAGVRKTHMIDGRTRHSLLLEIYTDVGVGTEITI